MPDFDFERCLQEHILKRRVVSALTFMVFIALAPMRGTISQGKPLLVDAPEPSMVDTTKVSITLVRSSCFGSCPAYKVTINGNGDVRFTSNQAMFTLPDITHRSFAQSRGVLLPGAHDDNISPEAVIKLIGQFENAGFKGLENEYRARITDIPTYALVLTTNTYTKTVVDYGGRGAGMPLSVSDLEGAVDKVAGTDRWVNGSAALIPWLVGNGFNFHSLQAAELAVAGEQHGAAEEMVSALIDRGAPMAQAVNVSANSFMVLINKPEIAGIALIQAAIKQGHAAIFKKLVARGWLRRLGKVGAGQLVAETAAGCSPTIVDAVADAGIDIDSVTAPQADAQSYRGTGRTALTQLTTTFACHFDQARRVETAKRLLARGANPNHHDSLGRTPLYGVNDLNLLDLLLAHGADVTAKSNDGLSMIFGCWNDDVAVAMLQAGASPRGRSGTEENKTFVQEARDRHMPKTTQWLEAHPEALQR